MTTNNGKLRLILWKKDPHCHWCGCVTILFPQLPKLKIPDNAATIDHIITKSEGRKGNGGPKVLSCKKCNELRGDRSLRLSKTKYGVWLASHRFPRLALKIDQEALLVDKLCDRCMRRGAFDFRVALLCQDCFMTCLVCNDFFVLGEDEKQKICWKCLQQNERDQKNQPYRVPKY